MEVIFKEKPENKFLEHVSIDEVSILCQSPYQALGM